MKLRLLKLHCRFLTSKSHWPLHCLDSRKIDPLDLVSSPNAFRILDNRWSFLDYYAVRRPNFRGIDRFQHEQVAVVMALAFSLPQRFLTLLHGFVLPIHKEPISRSVWRYRQPKLCSSTLPCRAATAGQISTASQR